MTNRLTHFEKQLTNTLASKAIPQRLRLAMQHSSLNGGKRIRPQLVYATGTALGAPIETLDAPAITVELIHCYSLVHDDLPSMDNDTLRRGKPTTHVEFDEATAILAGDALLNLAFEVLSRHNPHLTAETQLTLIRILSEASGALGMIGGQMLDLESEGKKLAAEDIETIHSLKTGKLIRASVLLGATVANAESPAIDSLDNFATAIGLAFQLKDDLLDAQGNSATLGKTAGLDRHNHKASAEVDATDIKQRATELLIESKKHLVDLAFDTSELNSLADLIVNRQS